MDLFVLAGNSTEPVDSPGNPLSPNPNLGYPGIIGESRCDRKPKRTALVSFGIADAIAAAIALSELTMQKSIASANPGCHPAFAV